MNKTLYKIILHLLLMSAIVFGVYQCNRADKSENELSSSKSIVMEANKIVEVIVDSDSNKITKSIPNEVLTNEAMETIKLIDSVSKPLKLAKNEKISTFHTVPIESNISLKAKEVTDEYAYTENENWYSRYNFKDSIFDLRYKTTYTSIQTEKKNTILGIEYKPVTKMQYDWITDTASSILSPTTVLKNSPKKTNSITLNGVSKYRNFDNSVLSGAELQINRNKFSLGGQYLYNFNTDRSNKTEWELSIKYKIF